ncbi:ricin-type beta-trefoil lectin domain protein [Cellulomonas sp. NPDC057328]|uniref:ricin-type beta-trefoil lectin domain protein n=1 Tax=Cellulomonas sp. NPDC057328 TaxID=3346101 RepID=UPI0036386E5C
MSMWAMLSAPLIAGNDIRSMSADVRAVLTNRDVLAIDQDPLVRQADRVRDDGDAEVWAKPLADGSVAVALLNRGGGARQIATTLAQVGLGSGSHTYRELWTGTTGTTAGALTAQVPAHGVALYRVTPGGGTTPPPTGNRLVSAASGRCLDVPASATTNGTGLVVWDCGTQANETWTATDGTLRSLGTCLDAPPDAAAGTRVQLWDCNGGTNQQWVLRADGTLRGTRSGLCLDVDRNLTANVTAVLLWHCTGAGNQVWSWR